MSILSQEFSKFYAKYPTRSFLTQYSVRECEAINTGREVRKLCFRHVAGYEIPHKLVKVSTSIYDKTCIPLSVSRLEIVRKDCDGFFCVEDGNHLRMNICELKTTADVESLCGAKNQIIGSFVRINSLLKHLQSYPNDIEVVGFIASHSPSLVLKSMWKKASDPKTIFCSKLVTNKNYIMPKDKLEAFYHPLKMHSITFHFVDIPDGKQSHDVNYRAYS